MLKVLRNTFFVGLGGALGTLLRHALNVLSFTPNFPLGTLIENVSGALLLGITSGFLASYSRAPDWVRTGIGVGFCGGYTTTSTFAADTFLVTLHTSPIIALIYAAASLTLGLFFAWGGLAVGKILASGGESL